MSWDRQNGPIKRTAFLATSVASNPLVSGDAGFWNQSGNPMFQTPGGLNVSLGAEWLTAPILLAQCASGNVVARVPYDTNFSLGGFHFSATQSPGASGSATFQLGINGASVSGGVITATANNLSGLARITGTAITGNAQSNSGEITVTVATALSGAFGGGQGNFYIKVGAPA